MGKRKKLPAALLAATLLIGLIGPAFAQEAGVYSDVAGHWAEEEIAKVTALGLIDGKTAHTFAPDENMTRADLVAALYRAAGRPAAPAGSANPFHDVADSAPYRDAVVWANVKGIAAGKSASQFDPDGAVTRQEIAKLFNLFAAVQVGKETLTNRQDVLSGYADAASVADWAKGPLNWAVASEFITGVPGNRLDPSGTATRAQVSAILCRYLADSATGDAALDKPRNENGIGENELLVVSFGTSFNDSRVKTIGAIEDAMEKAFPDYTVRRGFTSNIIIEHIFRRDGELIDDVKEALDRAKENGVKNLVVQPTHLMNGYEYGDLVKELEDCADDFEQIRIGAPLLTTDEDYAAVAQAMVEATAGFDDGKTAICYMGHGTEAAANGVYDKMQRILSDSGHSNYFVGTVEAEPSLEAVLKLVQAGNYERVVLRPMMIVAGDHANNDMAGDDADSWKSVFEANGFAGKVICEVKGLGELEGIQTLLVEHAKQAKPLDNTGIAVEPNPANKAKLSDGVYTIDVHCEGMFRVVFCELTVKDGQMSAAMTLSGTGHSKMFVGTAQEAGKATEGILGFVEQDGKYIFTVPVAALDTPLAYAAYGTKSGTWYDRVLTFDSATAVAK